VRVLALTNMYPPHSYGGYELSCSDVLRRFGEKGHDVAVLTTTVRKPGVDDAHHEPSDRVRRDLLMYWDDHVLVSPAIHRRVAMERHNRNVLEEALAAARPDVVSVWNMGAVSLGLLGLVAERRIPMVLIIEDDWLVYGPLLDAWSRLWKKPYIRPLARLVTAMSGLPTRLPDLGAIGAFCFISETTRRTAQDNTPWSFRTSGLVYLGIEASEFPVPPRDAPLDRRAWRGELVYVGRLDRRKGIDTAIAALAHLPGATLRVIGAGDLSVLTELEALARRLGLADRVTFTSAERRDLAKAYRIADACLFPSTWPEPFGLVPLEAMACDTPVVATGTGGSGEYLRHEGNCLLFPPGDERALAAAVSRLAVDETLRANLVRGGRRTAAALNTDGLSDLLETWHLGAIGGFPDGIPGDRRLPD
jgi:glycosyltransferase involved in cell wall biosynthesis